VLCRQCFQTKQRAAVPSDAAVTGTATAELVAAGSELGSVSSDLIAAAAQAPRA
jgi:hypothetical protein